MKLSYKNLFLGDSPIEAQGRSKEFITSMLIALILATAVLIIRSSAVGHLLLPVMLMPLVIIGMHYDDRLNSISRIAMRSATLAIVILFTFRIIQAIYSLAAEPPLWDMKNFWLDGRVAVQELNFYEPQNYQEVAQSLNLDFGSEFAEEILDNGFKYPPMTMLLFAPLGWFDIQTAALCWSILMGFLLVIDVLLLWMLFLPHTKVNGLIFISALTFMFPPIINNIWFGQTNFIILLVLLLFWRDRKSSYSGLWLAIGIIVKPFMAALLIYPLIKRQWQVIVMTLYALGGFSLLSLIIFGPTTFLSFFVSNPVSKVPPWFFLELDKGNLYATIWRLLYAYFGEGSLILAQPIFLSISVVLVSFTIWLIYRLISLSYDELSLAIILSLALLLYPNAGTNYCVALMPALLVLWTYRRRLIGGVWGVALFIGLEALLFGYNGGWSNFVFLGMAFNWLMFSVIGCAFLMRQRKEQLIIS